MMHPTQSNGQRPLHGILGMLATVLSLAMALTLQAQATEAVSSFAALVQPAANQPPVSGFYSSLKATPLGPEQTLSLSAKAGKRYPSKPTTETTERKLSLTQGKAQVINLTRPAVRVSVSDPSVASVVVISPWQLQVIGKQRGLTNLFVWEEGQGGQYKSFDLLVQRDVSMLTEQIRSIAPTVKVQPMVAKDTVILSGEVDSLEKAQLVLELAHAFFTPVRSAGGGGASGSSNANSGGGGASSQSGGNAAGGGSPSAGGGGSSGNGGGPSGGTSGATKASGNAHLVSTAPGSAMLGTPVNVINLLHVKGMPSTKVEMVQQKLTALHPTIKLDVVPANDGSEKAILTGRVPTTGLIAKAINLTSIFYGEPGVKVVSGPGGNTIRQSTSDSTFHTAESFSNNLDSNLLQGIVMTDSSGKVVSLMEVDKKPQIRASIKILEVSNKATNILGFPFSRISAGGFTIQNDLKPVGAPGALRQGLRSLGGGTLGFTAGDIDVTLQALEEKQLVRLLAEPTLTTLSGEKGSFLAGGEVPVPISDANGRITLEYKEFGIRLNMISTVTDDGKVNLQVAPEVSSIDPSLAFNSQLINIPGIRSRRMQTTVELLTGQSFVLAGLFSSADTESMSKFPFFANIPILGAFGKSNFRDKQDSELVVIIKPEIVTTEDVAQVSKGQP